MRIDAPRRTLTLVSLLGAWAIGILVLAAGCGKSDQAPGAAKKPKFEVAEEGKAGRAEGQLPDSGMAGNSAEAGPGSTGPSADSPVQPPAIPVDQLDKITIPTGTPQELLAFIEQLGRRAMAAQMQIQQGNMTPAALQPLFEAMLQTTDKILAANPDLETRRKAIDYKAGALTMLSQVAPDQPWSEQIRTFAASLAADQEPAVAIEGKCILFGILVGEIMQRRSQDVDGMMAQLKALVVDEARNRSVLDITQQAVIVLRAIGREDEAREAFELIAAAFKDHADAELAAESANMAEQLLLMNLGIEAKLRDLGQKREGAVEAFNAAIDSILERPNSGPVALERTLGYVGYLEQMGNYELAASVCQRIQEAYKENTDAAIRAGAKRATDVALRRLNLIGKPLVVEGVKLDGSSFDFSRYQGKVVLVAFWRTVSPRCQQELLNVKSSYGKYHEKGFEVVGVTLDQDPAVVNQFLDQAQLPWVTITGNKLAETCGVELIPFLLLLDQQGNVVDLYVQGGKLNDRLAELLGPAESGTSPTPESGQPGGSQSYNTRPIPRGDVRTAFVLAGPATGAMQVNALGGGDAARESNSTADPQAEDQQEEDTLSDEDEDVNPYLAPPGFSPAQLIDFLFTMEEKPKSIRRRPGFSEAVVDAADRILSANAQERFQLIAVDTKFSVLHETACLGSEQADRQLNAFVEKMGNDPRPAIARQVEFFRLERRALEADRLDVNTIPSLLADLKKFVEGQDKLQQRHLRLASATVHAINRLEDEKEREKFFDEFGNLFAKSDDRQLARYGKKLIGEGKGALADLVGKPLELAGVTAFGTQLDWNSYRGRVVLVDFWATWCGPCLQEMPHLRALSEKLVGAEFDIVAVSLDEDLEALAKYLDENKISWTNLVGPDARELATKYGVRGIPTMMLVDKTGAVINVGNKVEQLEPHIQPLLEGK